MGNNNFNSNNSSPYQKFHYKGYNSSPFTYLNIDNLIHLTHQEPDYLENKEFLLLIKLSAITQIGNNLIVKADTKQGYGYERFKNNPATITWIADFFNYSSRSYVSKIIKSLIEKGLIFEEMKDDNRKRLYLNPEFAFRGNRSDIDSKLGKKAKNYREDILDSNNIALPWKMMRRKVKRKYKIYNRSTYLHERSKMVTRSEKLNDFRNKLEEINSMMENSIKEMDDESTNHFSRTYKDYLGRYFRDLFYMRPMEKSKDKNEHHLETIELVKEHKAFLGKNFYAFIRNTYRAANFFEEHEGFSKTFASLFENLYPKSYRYLADADLENHGNHLKFFIQYFFLQIMVFLFEEADDPGCGFAKSLLGQNFTLQLDISGNEFSEITSDNFTLFSFFRPPELLGMPLANTINREQLYIEEEIREMDLLLYYLSHLYFENEIWFPRMYLLSPEFNSESICQFLSESKINSDKMHSLFETDNISELKENIDKIDHQHNEKSYSEVIPLLSSFSNIK